jgi:peptidoglycan/xylan/chitin deacetylase (PgdA/CDA1 family)
LKGERYNFATLDEVVDTPDEFKVALTFDDGYRHLREVLPTLIEEFGIRPTIFVPTGLIGRDNDWDYSHRFASCSHLSAEDIVNLSRIGVEFGSHGVSHTAFTQMSVEEIRTELTDSRRCLEDLTERPITTMSYPFGRVNRKIENLCREAGYSHALTMTYPRPTDADFAIGRMAVYGYDTPLTVLRKLSMKGLAFRAERCKAALTNRLAGGTILFDSRRRRATR